MSGRCRVGCGYVEQLLVPAQTEAIQAELTNVRHRTGRPVVLKSGATVLLTETQTFSGRLPCDGVFNPSAPKSWLAHRSLEEFLADWLRALDQRRDRVSVSWRNSFHFRTEATVDGQREPGLRIPQIGALHAIGAHWSVSSSPATIVMPTGTGKTETMLSALIAYRPRCLLVIVPSDALRRQIARKFLTLGVLGREGCLAAGVMHPVVGVLLRRPRCEEDLEIFQRCNVVIATPGLISQGAAVDWLPRVAELCSHLVFDEAHHVPAASWSALKKSFEKRHVLQFTATPFRTDGKLLEGKVIFGYPLKTALREGYFQHIAFRSVFEADPTDADEAIAAEAVRALREDLSRGLDHRLIARCNDTDRAEAVVEIYRRLASDLNPIAIHTKVQDVDEKIDQLRRGDHKIVVCVNMLAEGFDMPELKVAAAHDKHRSLASLLQFVGRIARVGNDRFGEATFVTNTAEETRTELLARLYREDPDWQDVLADVHAELTEREARMQELVRETRSLHVSEAEKPGSRPTFTTIKPKCSAVVRRASGFDPEQLLGAIRASGLSVEYCWLNEARRVMAVVTRALTPVDWAAGTGVKEDLWNLHVIHHDETNGLLFFNSSEEGDVRADWLAAVSRNTAAIVPDEGVFRVFGGLNRLLLIRVGVKKKGGNLKHRYSMFSGSDVTEALTSLDQRDSIRSNFFGHGFAEGRPQNFGASAKGKVWSLGAGRVSVFLEWCAKVAAKIVDASISPDTVFRQAIRPEVVQEVPRETILHVDWPEELWSYREDRILLIEEGGDPCPFFECDISLQSVAEDRRAIFFQISLEAHPILLRLELTTDADEGYRLTQQSGRPVSLKMGKREFSLTDYLTNYPPVLFFTNGSEMTGSLVYPIQGYERVFPDEQIVALNWNGIDIRRESLWRGGTTHTNTVQWHAYEQCRLENWDVILDDDGNHEAADLVCLRNNENRSITVRLVHCKYSGGRAPGIRIEDAVEVASQVTRCVRWNWNFEKLCSHLIYRDARRMRRHGRGRFLTGRLKELRQLMALGRIVPIEYEIIAVQPGIAQETITQQQKMVLGAADHFVRQTASVNLQLWCS